LAVRLKSGAGVSSEDLERHMARLEDTLGHRVRSTASASESGAGLRSGDGLDLDTLQASLGDRVLVEFVESDGCLVVVVIDERRCVMRRLTSVAEIAGLANTTLFALRKLARLASGSPAAPAALVGFHVRLGALRVSLLKSVLRLVGDRELVIVPTGRLHAMPWQLLVGPGRVVAVAPSAALWQRAAASQRDNRNRSGDVVAVAGPGLPGAAQEIDIVRRHHAGSKTITGAESTVSAVSAAIDGARLFHLAAHGDFRSDNPLFSSFRLADGPQTVYDLQRLSRAPHVVVLSACNSALSQVDAGNELLGLVASLLALGTSTAIAAVLPISDVATVPLMDRLHHCMASGERPGQALVSATAQMDPGDTAAIAASAAFVCLGAA